MANQVANRGISNQSIISFNTFGLRKTVSQPLGAAGEASRTHSQIFLLVRNVYGRGFQFGIAMVRLLFLVEGKDELGGPTTSTIADVQVALSRRNIQVHRCGGIEVSVRTLAIYGQGYEDQQAL